MKSVSRNIILIIASMGIFTEALDIAIINLAIPQIEKDLHLSSHSSYKLQSIYIIIYGCFLILGGKLSDFYGRKKIFLWGTAIFMLTSLGAGLSATFYSLLFFRAIQGLGAALLMPAAFSIVTYYFTEQQERSRAIAIFSSFAAIGSGSGLSIGGIITSYWGWSWVFLINVPILLAIILLASLLLENDVTENEKLPDIPAAIALVTTMLGITWITELLSHPAENYLKILCCLLAVIILSTILYIRLKKQPTPLLDLNLLSLTSLKRGNFLFVLLGALFTGYLFLMSFLVQKNFGFSTAQSGFLMMPFNLLSVLIARFALPVIAQKVSPKRFATWGAFAMLAGSLFLVFAVQYHQLIFLLAGGSFIAGVGMTLCFTGFSVIAMHKVPAEHLGVGGSLNTTAYLIGGGLGLPLFTSFMSSSMGITNSKPIWILCLIAVISIMVLSRDLES
jgi:MFS family permease